MQKQPPPSVMTAPEPTLAETIQTLFAASDEGQHAEQRYDAQINAAIQRFLSEPDSHTDIGLDVLVNSFLDSQIPDEPTDPEAYLRYLEQTVVAHSTHTAAPRFIGHMTSALPYFTRPLAKLMTAMNQNVVKIETAKTLTPYERQTLAMLHRLIYHQPDSFYDHHIQRAASTLGIVVSGGTVANISALWCARNAAYAPTDGFAGIEHAGLRAAEDAYGYRGSVVIGSSLMHYSFDKAADLMGIGLQNLIKIPADRRNRLDLRALHSAVERCKERNLRILALVGVAGTTDSGGIDPLAEIGALARELGTHFHVDAAWGGPLLFSEQHRHKLAGIEQADSVTIDGHKQLYLPVGIGMVLLRDPELARFIEKKAAYTVRTQSVDLGKRSLEGTRPGMVLFLHAALHLLGQAGYRHLIDEGMRKAQYMAATIRARPEFELLADPELNILLYRYVPEPWRAQAALGALTAADNAQINQFNERLQKLQRYVGHTFISRTVTLTSRYGAEVPIVALRSVLANPLTGEADIDAVLDDEVDLARQLMTGSAPAEL